MLPYSYIGSGTYTQGSTVAAVRVPLSDRPDWFYVKDITNWNAQTGGPPTTNYLAVNPLYAEWYSSMAAGSYIGMQQSASILATSPFLPISGTSGGFTFVDPSNPPTYASLANTTIDKTTYVVTMANTGSIAVGDYVRLYNETGMLQLSGYPFQVTAVTANTSITLGYMASGGYVQAANATAGFVKKFLPNAFYPRLRFIANITQATQAVVYFTEKNDFTPGELVDFTIPAQYGMQELNYRTKLPGGAARVLSVTNSATVSSITIDVDTTGFTAFAFPLSASIKAGGGSPATCYPAGSGVVPLNGSATVPQSPPGTNLQDAFDNRNQYYMLLGSSVSGIANATMQWMAFKADYGNLSNA